MSAAVLALIGATLVCLGGTAAGHRVDAGRPWWPAAVALGVALALVGLWWWAAPAGELAAALNVPAMLDGTPMSTVVEARPLGGQRAFRLISPGRLEAGPVLAFQWGALACLAAAGALLVVGAGVMRQVLTLVAPVAAGLAWWQLQSITGGGSGADDLRALLAPMVESGHLGRIASLTVPEGAWTFEAVGGPAMMAACAVAGLVALLDRVGGTITVPVRPVVAVGAVLCAAAPVALVLQTGGLPWRAVEACLWATGLLACGAALDEVSSPRAATLGAGALALALMALVV